MKNLPALIVLSKALIVIAIGSAFYFLDEEGSMPLIVIGMVLFVAAILLFIFLPPKNGNKSYF